MGKCESCSATPTDLNVSTVKNVAKLYYDCIAADPGNHPFIVNADNVPKLKRFNSFFKIAMQVANCTETASSLIVISLSRRKKH